MLSITGRRTPSITGRTASNSGTKPPNVLIYQSDKDATNKNFIQTKNSLEYCLAPERYVIYTLGDDDILQHSPWKDNCRLLVIPSPPTGHAQEFGDQDITLTPRLIEELIAYAIDGGRLLCMDPSINHLLGLASVGETLAQEKRPLLEYCQNGVCEVEGVFDSHNGGMEPKHRFSALVPTSCETKNGSYYGEYLGSIPLKNSIVSSTDLAYLISLEWTVDQNTNECNNNHPIKSPEEGRTHDPALRCVRRLTFTSTGSAIISNINLLPLNPPGLEISQLVRLKKGVTLRGSFLSHLLGGLGLECSTEVLPNLTHTYLICSKEHHSLFLSAIDPLLSDPVIPGKDISIRIISIDYAMGTPVDQPPRPSTSEQTIVTQPAQWQLDSLPFSSQEYFRKLETRELGRTVLHTPVITSTQLPFTGNMAFCHALQPEMGVVWVATQQTQGKGRSGNAWISPIGSMMFSTSLPLPSNTRLSSHLPLLQHIVAVAVVYAIRSLPGYEEVPVRIKWPNDIYYKSQVKLGGILVSCISIGSGLTQSAIIGCGVNVSNQHPTMSINDAIDIFNKESGRDLSPLTVEMMLAGTFNWLEKLLSLYEVQGLEEVLKLYYKYWLHSNATVYLASHGEEEAVVTGIDKYGYLQVLRKGGERLSLQPDGNSFDIMKGLIVMKK